jgi:dsDNA-specific endonuclease/ATPase MutS2
MKPLSQKLADLSVQAKNAEDRVAKVQTEASGRIEEQREFVRQEAEQALGKVKQRFDEAKGEARNRFEALQTKANADFEQIRQKASETKGKFEAWRAENYASDREADALAAIDYAIAATKVAEVLTLDALAARAKADSKAEQIKPEPTLA